MIIQSDLQAAERMCPLDRNASIEDVAGHFAAYRESLLSDGRVEEVARAIVEATDGPWDWFSELGQEAARTQARAVLKTLRGEA